VAANRTGSAITFRLSVHVESLYGAGADDKQYIYYELKKSVAANDSLAIVLGITLNQTDVIGKEYKVYTSAVKQID
jgi:hypothetical protein